MGVESAPSEPSEEAADAALRRRRLGGGSASPSAASALGSSAASALGSSVAGFARRRRLGGAWAATSPRPQPGPAPRAPRAHPRAARRPAVQRSAGAGAASARASGSSGSASRSWPGADRSSSETGADEVCSRAPPPPWPAGDDGAAWAPRSSLRTPRPRRATRRRRRHRGLDRGGRVQRRVLPGRHRARRRRCGHRRRLGIRALLAPPARAPPLALGEVAQQLARQRARLAGHPRARPAQDLLGLGRVRHRGREQRRAEPAVVLAGGVDEPARVARVGAAAGVDEQPEQPLGLGPALHGVLLVHVARVLGQAPDPRVGLVAPADALLGQRLEHDLGSLAPLVAGPRADHVDRQVEGLGVLGRRDLLQRAQSQLRVAVALDRGEQEAALELAGAVEVQHGPRPAPAAGGHAGTGQGRPHVLLAVVEVLDGDPPQLALEDLVAALLVRRHRDHAAFDAHAAAATAAHGPDDDRAAAVDVAVEQRVQRDDRVVVLGGRVDEVDDDARLLARMAARDAAHALLVDALGGRRREVHADRRTR